MEGHQSSPGDPPTHEEPCQRTPARTMDFSEKKHLHRLHTKDPCGQKTAGRHSKTSENVPVISQVRTIQIPKSMKNEAFLKHPDLTMGQKRYLCSIARIYSTSNMRAILDHQSQIRCGSRKTHLSNQISGRLKNGTKDQCTRSQMNHCETKHKSCISGVEDNISGMEATFIMEDQQQTADTTALTTEETTSQWIESLSINDNKNDQ